MSYEGTLVADEHVDIIKQRFAALPDKCRNTIREIAAEAHGDISMTPPTERRVGIARILLEIGEFDQWIDKDLVRSVCEQRTGKKYPNAGAALASLSWVDAERVWSSLQDIYADRVHLTYNPDNNTYTFTKKEKK